MLLLPFTVWLGFIGAIPIIGWLAQPTVGMGLFGMGVGAVWSAALPGSGASGVWMSAILSGAFTFGVVLVNGVMAMFNTGRPIGEVLENALVGWSFYRAMYYMMWLMLVIGLILWALPL